MTDHRRRGAVDYFFIQEHKYPRIRIGGFTFTASVNVTYRATKTEQRVTRQGEPLWALPGGSEATERDIRMLMGVPE